MGLPAEPGFSRQVTADLTCGHVGRSRHAAHEFDLLYPWRQVSGLFLGLQYQSHMLQPMPGWGWPAQWPCALEGAGHQAQVC